MKINFSILDILFSIPLLINYVHVVGVDWRFILAISILSFAIFSLILFILVSIASPKTYREWI